MQPFERQEDTPLVPLIVMRIEAPTASVDEFITQYCRYFKEDVMFLPTEGFQPPGRRVRFTFALSDGREAVWGEGIVLRMRRDSNDPQRPPGMELHYSVLDEASQRVIDRMLALRLSGTAMQRPDPPPYESMFVETSHEPERPRAVPLALPEDVVPANPFADVATNLILEFVEWAFERATDPCEPTGTIATHAPEAAAPRPADGSARAPARWLSYARRRRRRALVVTYAAGFLTAVAFISAGGVLVSRRPAASAPPRAAGVATTRLPLALAPLVTPRKPRPPQNADQTNATPTNATPTNATPTNATPTNATTTNATTTNATTTNATTTNATTTNATTTNATTRHAERSDVDAAPRKSAVPPRSSLVPLAIAATPAGSFVQVDDGPRRRAPVTFSVEEGPHTLVIDRPRYATRRIELDAPGSVVVPLERPAATLSVRTTPPGAEVRLDGRAIGRAPLEVTTTRFEQHRVAVALDGTSARRRFYLRAPSAALDFALSR